jgi:D-alanine transaminase
MARIVFVNGDYKPIEEASLPLMDRGFLFGDGIYEVSAVINGRLVDAEPHLARLERSLEAVRIANPYSRADWTGLMEELMRRNGVVEGLVYLQVTRGAAERDFGFPKDARPTVVMFTQTKAITRSPQAESGVSVVSVEDLRWKRRDIKSVALLAQVLAKQAAVEAGAFEAWMVEDGLVTEGSSSTAFIIAPGGAIVTRPLSTAILPGITRLSVMRLAAEQGLSIDERPFSLEEAYGAAEAFLTSASSFVMPVVSIDGRAIGNGRPGPMARRLRALYLEMAGAPAAAA